MALGLVVRLRRVCRLGGGSFDCGPQGREPLLRMTELRWCGREHTPGAKAIFFMRPMRPKAEALGYLVAVLHCTQDDNPIARIYLA